MLDHLDRRVVPEALVELVRAVQSREPCHLGGGVALAGGHLAHRLSGDLDLFVHDPAAHRRTCRHVEDVVAAVGGTLAVVQDAGSFWRARVVLGAVSTEIDVVHESLPDLAEPPLPIDGVVLESIIDLRASKLTCLLSRSEPRDLVDVLFLQRAGFDPEADLPLALQKDAGIDPATLAWLLTSFPVAPLPRMLLPLTTDELRAYRDDLAERFRRLALG
jgi:nucleotidyltransferase AbiEii toxin of type IV toxin-antitoxin system